MADLNAGATSAAPYEVAGMARVRDLYDQLNSSTSLVQASVSSVLKRQEIEFLKAFRSHMYVVQKEIQSLRAKADDAAARNARDEQMRALLQERDWFSAQALQLNTECQSLRKELGAARERAEKAEERTRWLERDLMSRSERRNKSGTVITTTTSHVRTGEGVQHAEGPRDVDSK